LYMNTIGPYWDANEVWLITAGGAMFAAFPHWYATMFSGFYIPLVFMLLALILRGVSFEFWGKVENQKWRNTWDWTLFIVSLLPPILWGVVLSNFMTGMPINGEKEMTGHFVQFLHPFALLGGVMFLLLTITHGLQFITIRTTGELQARARRLGKKVAPFTIVFFLAFIVVGYFLYDFFTYLGQTFVWLVIIVAPFMIVFFLAFIVVVYFISDVFTYHGQTFMVLPMLAWVALLFANLYNTQKMDFNAFTLTSVTIILLIGSIFIGMFPRI